MNEFDKQVAQANGSRLGLPPYGMYVLEYMLNDTEEAKAIDKGDHYEVHTKYIDNQSTGYRGNVKANEKFHVRVVPKSLLIHEYPIYYDDPQETTEEVIEWLKEIEFENSVVPELRGVVYKSIYDSKSLALDSEMHYTFLRDDKRYYSRLDVQPIYYKKDIEFKPLFSSNH